MFAQTQHTLEPDASDVWTRAINTLKERHNLGPRGLVYINNVQPVNLVNNNLIVAVPHESTRAYLENNIKEDLLSVLYELTDRDVAIAVTIDPSLNSDIAGSSSSPKIGGFDDIKLPTYERNGGSKTLVEPVPAPTLNPSYTFDSFVVGHSNRLAHAAALAVAETPARAYNPLFIYGGSGLGKTHLLHAIGHYAYNLSPNLRVKYLNAESFFTDFINSVATGEGMTAFRRRYRDVDILLLDDIQFMGGKERGLEEFFHTFEALHGSHRQIVLTSDVPPKQLTGFEERYTSRFNWGLTASVQVADLETRIAILRRKTEDNPKLRMDGEVLNYIASKIVTNIRELEGALTRVAAYASLNGEPITMQLAEDVLKDLISDDGDHKFSGTEILEQTARYFGLTVEDITCKRRLAALVEARSIAMYLCRTMTEMSYPDIGRLFSRDHATVISAFNKIEAKRLEHPATYNQVTELEARIRKQNHPTQN